MTADSRKAPASIDPADVLFSRHALQRAHEMGLDPEEIRQALLSPSVRPYTGVKHADVFHYTNGTITIPVREDKTGKKKWWAVTMLWATPELWQADKSIRVEDQSKTLQDWRKKSRPRVD